MTSTAATAAPDPIAHALDTLHHFAEVFSETHLIRNLAEKLTCTELEALAELLEAAGYFGAADVWRSEHEETDEKGDAHYTGTDAA